MIPREPSELEKLIGELPAELAEEGTTGRDLIEAIIFEAKEEERVLHETNLHQHNN